MITVSGRPLCFDISIALDAETRLIYDLCQTQGTREKLELVGSAKGCKEDETRCEVRDGQSHQPRPGDPVRRWLSLPVVFEVERNEVVRVRVAGCDIRQELAAAEVANAATQVEVLIELIPGIGIELRAQMAAVASLVGHDRGA